MSSVQDCVIRIIHRRFVFPRELQRPQSPQIALGGVHEAILQFNDKIIPELADATYSKAKIALNLYAGNTENVLTAYEKATAPKTVTYPIQFGTEALWDQGLKISCVQDIRLMSLSIEM